MITLFQACGIFSDPGQGGDTGTVELPAPCSEQPCVADVADAMWTADVDWAAYGGHALAVLGDHVAVGAPLKVYEYAGLARVHLLKLDDLTEQGAWLGDGDLDEAGFALDAADIDGDGAPELAIGRPNAGTGDHGSLVHIVPGTVTGHAAAAEPALLTILGDPDVGLGRSLLFTAGGTELVVSGFHQTATAGRVLTFATVMRGTVDQSFASSAITSALPLGTVETWDGDRDGVADLVVQDPFSGAAWFPAPWSSGSILDRTAAWSDSCVSDCALGEVLENVGDVTGDGAEDLVIAAPRYGLPQQYAGRAFVVEAAVPGEHEASALPLQLHGREESDGMGYALAGADIDGDGARDLVASASGYATSPSVLLMFAGPLSNGTLVEADAASRLFGEHARDMFVRSIEVVNIDGDERDDLVVGAPGYPEGQGRGAVYLLNGAAIVP